MTDRPPRRRDCCQRCGHEITWAESRRQWGRLVRAGLDATEAKSLQPRCQKCSTAYLRERSVLAVIADNRPSSGPIAVKEIASAAGIPAVKARRAIERLIGSGRLTGAVAWDGGNQLVWDPARSDQRPARPRRQPRPRGRVLTCGSCGHGCCERRQAAYFLAVAAAGALPAVIGKTPLCHRCTARVVRSARRRQRQHERAVGLAVPGRQTLAIAGD